MSMLSIEKKKELLRYEVLQCHEEGKDIGEDIEGLEMEIQRAKNEEELNKIYEALTIKGYRKNWKYYEPNELEEIEKLTRRLNIKENFCYDSLKSKIAGAWIGRIVGNMLGKPVE